MPANAPQKFGLGAYWPDDFTDYLVHFHDPFAVFRIEADREGPILFWGSPFLFLPPNQESPKG